MYNFDEKINQKGTVDEKHDQIGEFFPREDLLPMWVAEMDFKTAPAVQNALAKRVEHGIFGYTFRSDSYYESIINWYKTRHHVDIKREDLSFDIGVVKAVYEMLRIFTKEHDDILVPVPAYPQFGKAIALTNRNMVAFPLTNVNNRYEFDFDALKEELKHCTMFILCSPHNPGGRIWTRSELETIVKLCEETNTVLISDEIHCDLTMNHCEFISLIEVSDKCVVINSASKSFNLAGLQHSYNICKDKEMQARIEDHFMKNKVKSTNILSMTALEAAYTNGGEWRDALCDYLYDNYKFVKAFVEEHHLDLPVFELEAGYLLWVDFSAYFKTAEETEDFLVNTCQIATTWGRNFGEGYGTYTRLNIGTQRAVCKDAMERIYNGLKKVGKL